MFHVQSLSSSELTPQETPAEEIDEERIKKAIKAVDPLIAAAAKADKEGTKQKVIDIIGTANYKACKDINLLTALYKAFKE